MGPSVLLGLSGVYLDVSPSVVPVSVLVNEALPTFETDRLLIRPRTMADYEACLAIDRGTMPRHMSGS